MDGHIWSYTLLGNTHFVYYPVIAKSNAFGYHYRIAEQIPLFISRKIPLSAKHYLKLSKRKYRAEHYCV